MKIGWTTIGTLAAAKVLARGLIENRFAACVQIDGPITSVYRWDDETSSEEEYRLTVKFLPENSTAVEGHLAAAHPYDTPEWIVVDAEYVSEKYLSWAKANSSSLTL
ncbi:MAG: divalent-cation tolerance protein CutA [Synoicihabitans sp.]